MKIGMVKPLTFGYKSVLKKEWRKGKMPFVIKDIYGDVLIRGQETIEHVIPKSKGGKSRLSNYALANAENNIRRSNSDLSNFIPLDTIKDYLKQFEGIKLPKFNGDDYIKNLTKTLKKIGYDL